MMLKDVIAVFDIGKTNKKFLLFDQELRLVKQKEVQFSELPDDEGYPCDDIENIEEWISNCLLSNTEDTVYKIKGVNFTTYGATLVYIDNKGNRLSPLINYLKPMPEGILNGFYEKYGGVHEFSRRTASPAMGMLNSGMQILWLKKTRPELFSRIGAILHFPQYLSYRFTGKITSEYTSIGCHTALWDFDLQRYHDWVSDEEISLPVPVSNSAIFPVPVHGQEIKFGIGIHDSSSSMVPYFKGTDGNFILISTGTWCIIMNPFNDKPLTKEQLEKDSLCYMSIRQQPVKSSRFFLGHIHDVNLERLTGAFGVEKNYFKTLKISESQISSFHLNMPGRVFFRNGIPADHVDNETDLKQFRNFDEAYLRFLFDVTALLMESFNLVVSKDIKKVYITGGFARNEAFVRILASFLPHHDVYVSEIDKSTALGAAMVIWEEVFEKQIPDINMGLNKIGCSV